MCKSPIIDHNKLAKIKQIIINAIQCTDKGHHYHDDFSFSNQKQIAYIFTMTVNNQWINVGVNTSTCTRILKEDRQQKCKSLHNDT